MKLKMKKQYIQPITDVVNVHLRGSVLYDDTLPIERGSKYAVTMWGNESDLWDDDTDEAFAPSTNNLWDE